MAKNTEVQVGTENIKLPEYALESTSAEMLKQMKAVADNNKALLDAMEALIKQTAESVKTGKDGDAKVVAAVNQAKGTSGTRNKVADRIEADTQQVFEFFGKSIGFVSKGLAGLAGVTVAVTASLYSAYSSLSDNIYQLQQVGAGFDSVNGTVLDAIANFNQLGIDTETAVKMMTEFSRTTAIVGRDRLPKLTKQFLDLTNKGRNLGLNLEQASESVLEEIENRSRIMDISDMEESRLAKSALNQLNVQNAYSTALGISVEKLRAGTAATLEGNHLVAATLAQFPEAYDGLTGFTTASIATLGEQGQALTDAMVNAATGLSGFSTESSRALGGLSSIAPDLHLVMSDINYAVQNGGMKTVEDGMKFSKRLNASLLATDVEMLKKVSYMNNEVGQMARTVLLARANLEASAKKEQELADTLGNIKVNEVRDSIIKFENAMAIISGQFSKFKMSMMVTLSPLLSAIADVAAHPDTIKALSEGLSQISTSLMGLLKALLGADAGASTVEDLMKNLPAQINKFTHSISTTIDKITAWVRKFEKDTGETDWTGLIASGLANIIIETGKLLASAIWEATKEMLTSPTGWIIIGGLAGAALAKSIAGAVLTTAGTTIASKLPGMGGIAGPGGIGGVAGKAGPMASFGNMAGGALQIVALAGAVLALAQAMRMIDDLKNGWESLGMLAVGLTGLAVAGQLLGKAGTAMQKGIVVLYELGGAMLLIGASIALWGWGLGQMTPFVESIGTVITRVGETVTKIVKGVGDAVVSVVDSITRGIVAVKGAFSSADQANMQARVDAVKQLSDIPNSNINQTAQAISNLASAMARFGGAAGEGSWNIIGADFEDATQERLDAFNLFAQMDYAGISRSANAINKLTHALLGFSSLDGAAIRSVSGAVDVMSQTNDRATATYDRFGRLDTTAIDKASLAVFNMNAANRGHIVAPTPNANGNFLSNMAKSISGYVADTDKDKKGTEGSGSKPAEAKGSNRMEELMVKLVNNTYVSAKQLKEIAINTKD